MSMNDPHVVRLIYKLTTDESVSYNSPSPIVFSDPAFELILENGILIAEMKEHHTSVGSAMENVRPALRAWEIQTALKCGDTVRFEFDRSEVIDRNPSPPGSNILHAECGIFTLTGMAARMQVVRRKYPPPPTAFKVTPLVEMLWNRLQQYRNGKDLLATMGYACLSAIQADTLGRGKASNQYGIDRDVLDKFGKLTSEVGDELTARKFDSSSSKRTHTSREQNWIVEVVKILIGRVAEYEHNPGAPLRQITMADLPKL
jgi:hypothetical protein